MGHRILTRICAILSKRIGETHCARQLPSLIMYPHYLHKLSPVWSILHNMDPSRWWTIAIDTSFTITSADHRNQHVQISSKNKRWRQIQHITEYACGKLSIAFVGNYQLDQIKLQCVETMRESWWQARVKVWFIKVGEWFWDVSIIKGAALMETTH